MTDRIPIRGPVVVVTGPTAAGKTERAVALAEQFGGEIINADSVQVYRYLDIGTAKPGPELRSRAPHHLLDVVTPDIPYNAGRYEREATAAAAAIHEGGRPVILTGGTGLYIRAFLAGLIDAEVADPELRAHLERAAERARAEGDPQRLHRRLALLDAASAAEIHPNDQRRTIRALEIIEGLGIPASELRGEHRFGARRYPTLYLVLDPGRRALDERIEKRTRAMVEAGLLREARALRERGYGPELRPLQAIGYRHMAAVVDGLDTLDNAAAAMARDTRRFARRQRTWFRGVADAQWCDPDDAAAIAARVAEFLNDAARGVG